MFIFIFSNILKGFCLRYINSKLTYNSLHLRLFVSLCTASRTLHLWQNEALLLRSTIFTIILFDSTKT